MPIPLVTNNNPNVGPAKLPGDLALTDLLGRQTGGLTEDELREQAATQQGLRGQGFTGENVGPAKKPGDRTLPESIVSTAPFLNPFAQANPQGTGRIGDPRGSDAELAQRRSMEAALDLPIGTLDRDDTFAGEVFFALPGMGRHFDPNEFASVSERNRALRDRLMAENPGVPWETLIADYNLRFTSEAPRGEAFTAIEEFGLQGDSLARFEQLVSSNKIDLDLLWTIENPLEHRTSPTTIQERIEYDRWLNKTILQRHEEKGTRITPLQALDIIVQREGISNFDPTTGFTWDEESLLRSQQFARAYVEAMGLPFVNPWQPGAERLSFTRVPTEERTAGSPGGTRGDTALRNQLTLEEYVQVAELVSGRRRGTLDPRGVWQPGTPVTPGTIVDANTDETLFYGDYVL